MVKSVVMAGVLAVMTLATGCEKTTTSKSLVVTPAASEIEPRAAVVLTAAIPGTTNVTNRIYYPLEWTVGNGALGSIRDTAGDTAVYVANNVEGVNTVAVRDQTGVEGVASITQAKPEETTAPE